MIDDTIFDPSVYKDWFFKNHTKDVYKFEEVLGYALVEKMGIKSMLDLGCGIGRWMKGAADAGLKDMLGIEYCIDTSKRYFYDNIKDLIIYGDVTNELNLNRTFDCVISIEVAEHIEPSKSEMFVRNIVNYSHNIIIVTAAPPGQPGDGHINCRDKDYWIDLFEKNGLVFKTKDQEIVHHIMDESSIEVPSYITQNLIVFRK